MPLPIKREQVLRLAVRRMMPKGALGNKMLTKLKSYDGPEHPQAAQEPKEMKLTVKNVSV